MILNKFIIYRLMPNILFGPGKETENIVTDEVSRDWTENWSGLGRLLAWIDRIMTRSCCLEKVVVWAGAMDYILLHNRGLLQVTSGNVR